MSASARTSRFDLSGHSLRDSIASITQASVEAYPETGGVVTFEGRVRNHHRGRTVVSLSYSAYDRLARNEGEQIINEATARFELSFARAIHRTGDLHIGDIAVWIIAGAPHRESAFSGCRYIIEEIKTRLPVWKHEFYADGSDEWVYAGM